MCACVHFCHILYEDVNFLYVLYACILLICIIRGICALYVFLKVVKRFEILKVLYKFPVIIINKFIN